MPTRSVVLPEHLAKLVKNLVESGRYKNASEVIREGLRLLERREEEDQLRLRDIREAVNVGVADMAAGRYSTFETRESLRKGLSKSSVMARNSERGGIDFEKLEAARRQLGSEGDGEGWPEEFDDPASSCKVLDLDQKPAPAGSHEK